MNKLSVKSIALLTIVAFTGCAGNETARPISNLQYGDEKISCEQIISQINNANNEIRILEKEIGDKSSQNVAVFVIGMLILWPVFFAADFSDDEDIELQAWQSRKSVLTAMQIDRC